MAGQAVVGTASDRVVPRGIYREVFPIYTPWLYQGDAFPANII